MRADVLPGISTYVYSWSSERCYGVATERILFIYRYIYVIYIKYIEIIIYIYYTRSYNIYISHIWTRKSMETSSMVLLSEKCFNFHIPIRWHLISQLVGDGLKMAVRAVPRALAFGHPLES